MALKVPPQLRGLTGGWYKEVYDFFETIVAYLNGGGGFLSQGGNAFGAPVQVGSTDAEPADLISGGVAGVTVDNTEGIVAVGLGNQAGIGIEETGPSAASVVITAGNPSLISPHANSIIIAGGGGVSISIDPGPTGGAVLSGAGAGQAGVNIGDTSGSPASTAGVSIDAVASVKIGAGLSTQVEIGNVHTSVGFLGAAPTARPTVTGSRGGNVALASLLTALASLGLITDNSTA
jgi:hypothetical protein